MTTQGSSTADNRIILDPNFPITSSGSPKYKTPANIYGATAMTFSMYIGPLNNDSMKRSQSSFYVGMVI